MASTVMGNLQLLFQENGQASIFAGLVADSKDSITWTVHMDIQQKWFLDGVPLCVLCMCWCTLNASSWTKEYKLDVGWLDVVVGCWMVGCSCWMLLDVR